MPVTTRQVLPLLACFAAVSAALAQGTAQTELKLGVDRTRVKVEKLGKTDMPTLQEVLEKRVAVVAGSEGEVEITDRDDIRVLVPLEKLTEHQVRVLTQPGRIEFRVLEDVHSNLNPDGRYLIDVLTVQDETTLRFRNRQTNQQVQTSTLLAKSPLLFDNADFAPEGAHLLGSSLVRVRLNEKATSRLKQFLKKPGRLMAVVMDGEVLAINASVTPIAPPRSGKKKKKKKAEPEVVGAEPAAEEPDQNAGIVDIPGAFSKPEEAAQLAGMINAGMLPYPLTVRSRRIVAESQPPADKR
jgi:preprotein translocase subunit SecD